MKAHPAYLQVLNLDDHDAAAESFFMYTNILD